MCWRPFCCDICPRDGFGVKGGGDGGVDGLWLNFVVRLLYSSVVLSG